VTAIDPDAPTGASPSQTEGLKQYPCKACGAKLQFKPGASALTCTFCGAETAIPQSEADIAEMDFHAWAAVAGKEAPLEEQRAVRCEACGAETVLEGSEMAKRCAFCDSPLVAEATVQRRIKPQSLLPFKLQKEEAAACFQKWVSSRWFAPSDLQATARAAAIDGVYTPYWTYDSNTESFYRGERGIDYYETESYTTTENGQTVTKTRQVKKTRWYSVSGVVWNSFDDVLVVGSRSLPAPLAQRLEPWDLKSLVPYSDDYLAGFIAEAYQVQLAEGFESAKKIMDMHIREAVRRDIGGDQQRIHSVKTRYDDITFKHVLLPIWISAYRYRDKVWRFLVNARTGEVQGERPYSALKIAMLVTFIVALIGLLVYFGQAAN
jgi:hypothetical protein